MGEKQARALAPLLAGVPATVSPARAAARSAPAAPGPPPCCPVDETEDLAEWAYGEYEGVTTAEIRKTRPGWTIWTGDPPGGETAAEVGARADRMLARHPAGAADRAGGHRRARPLQPGAGRPLARPAGDAAGRCSCSARPVRSLLGQEHGQPAVHRWNVPNPAERDPG